jgi:adenine-specific DNA-methyltransferase
MQKLQEVVAIEISTSEHPVDYSQTLVEFAQQSGRAFVAGITRDDQKTAGQFMTPPKIAKFMAQRLVRSVDHLHVRLLEPSAGGGVLIAAAVEALLEKPNLHTWFLSKL